MSMLDLNSWFLRIKEIRFLILSKNPSQCFLILSWVKIKKFYIYSYYTENLIPSHQNSLFSGSGLSTLSKILLKKFCCFRLFSIEEKWRINNSTKDSYSLFRDSLEPFSSSWFIINRESNVDLSLKILASINKIKYFYHDVF